MKQHENELVICALNRISRLTTVDKAEDARGLISLLVSVLRYRYNRREQLVPVSAELEAASSLFDLLRECFGDRLEVGIPAVEEEMTDAFIPHYAILTFVENCLYHAFDERMEVWEVGVSLARKENAVSVEVRDNGRGFDPAAYMNPGADTGWDYGSLRSTLSRLRSYYGDEYEVRIDSSADGGTVVRMELPLY